LPGNVLNELCYYAGNYRTRQILEQPTFARVFLESCSQSIYYSICLVLASIFRTQIIVCCTIRIDQTYRYKIHVLSMKQKADL